MLSFLLYNKVNDFVTITLACSDKFKHLIRRGRLGLM